MKMKLSDAANLAEVVASQAVMLERAGRPTDELPPERLEAIFQAQVEDALA